MKGVQPSTLWKHSGHGAPGQGTGRANPEQPHPSGHKSSAPKGALAWGCQGRRHGGGEGEVAEGCVGSLGRGAIHCRGPGHLGVGVAIPCIRGPGAPARPISFVRISKASSPPWSHIDPGSGLGAYEALSSPVPPGDREAPRLSLNCMAQPDLVPHRHLLLSHPLTIHRGFH